MHNKSTTTPGILEDVQYQEDIHSLADEIRSILSVMSNNASTIVIETNHRVGEAIVSHTAYKKARHGSGTLIKQLALETGKSVAHLYLCVQFYQKYPELSNALETLQSDQAKLTWRHVLEDLSGGADAEPCEHEEIYVVKYNCCRSCGSRVEKPNI